MSVDRTEGRRAHQRAFRPTVDGRLEPRVLLHGHSLPGQIFLANPIGFAYAHNNPPFLKNSPGLEHTTNPLTPHFGTATGRNGQKVRIYQNGGVWDVTLTEYPPAIEPGGTAAEAAASSSQAVPAHTQTAGTVRAYAMGNGQVAIIVDGSNALTDLTVNYVGFPTVKGFAHSFAYAYAKRPRILNIGAIDVTSGSIGAIEGFHTANLSGPIDVKGPGTVDRIALNSILPGGAIHVGGTLNTLDVYGNANLSGGGSINVANNLNLLNVGQDLSLTNGSALTVGGTLGLLPQAAKGSGTGSSILTLNQSNLAGGGSVQAYPNVAAYIQGNLNIGAGSAFAVGNGIEPGSILFVGGNVTGGSHILIPNLFPVPPLRSYTQATNPNLTFVATGTYTP